MPAIILTLTLVLSQVEDVQTKIPLITEVSINHPLFIFACKLENVDPGYVKEKISNQWSTLREELKPYSALQIIFSDPTFQDIGKIEDSFTSIFGEVKVPIILRLCVRVKKDFLPEAQELSALFARLPNLIGLCISDFSLNLYPSESGLVYPEFYQLDWLCSLVKVVSRYGRFVYLPMNSFELVRVLSHPKGEELLDLIKANSEYVIAGYSFDGDFAPIGIGALLGLYLGGYVNRIGIECGVDWYHRSYLVSPCVLGKAPPGSISIYTPFYRGMLLLGVLGGATTYLIPDEECLWGGKENIHWIRTIEKTLLQIVNLGLIPSKEMIQRRVSAGYRCFPAGTPQDFWKLGEILFPQFGLGAMAESVYFAKEGKKLPEIIPETGSNYILPLFPYKYSPEDSEMYIVGYQPTHPEWTWSNVLERISRTLGEGTAFIAEVGKYLFVFNTSEYQIQKQSYKIALPSPVRKFVATRVGDGIQLSWGFREGDISYQVYRKSPTESEYKLMVRGIESREWKDTSLDMAQPVSYSVTALTTEQEIVEGFVNPGEYLVFSLIESRIAEEVVLLPEMNFAESVPITESPQGENLICPDPINFLAPEEQEMAQSINNSLLMLESAIMRRDIDAVCGIFSEDYKDPLSSGVGYIKCALQTFFNVVPSPKVLYQVRNFNFQRDENGNIIVNTQVFLRVLGYKVSDELGIKSGIPIEIGPSEDGETLLSWVKRDSLWVINSSEKPLFFPTQQ